MTFAYGEKETEYLISRDKRLGAAIERIGHIDRAVEDDLFSSLVHHIIGQQISTHAQATIWQRLQDSVGTVNAGGVASLTLDELQALGMSFRKAGYIRDFTRQVQTGAFDVEALATLPDDEIIRRLTALRGVGVWTAEMLLTFCLQRPDVVSYGDLAIHRGMRMLYRRRNIDRETFARFARRYSPHGTVASLYLWAIAGGALPELTDPAPQRVKEKK